MNGQVREGRVRGGGALLETGGGRDMEKVLDEINAEQISNGSSGIGVLKKRRSSADDLGGGEEVGGRPQAFVALGRFSYGVFYVPFRPRPLEGSDGKIKKRGGKMVLGREDLTQGGKHII